MPDNLKMSKWMQAALVLQLCYVGMSVFWNLIGVGLIDAGLQPLGPVANLQTVYLLLLVGLVLVISSRKSIWVYAPLSGLLAFGALSTIHGSFTGPAELWPSGYFRLFGALINLEGLFASALALFIMLRAVLSKNQAAV